MPVPVQADPGRTASPEATRWDRFDGDVLAGPSRDFRVGLLVPMCGSAGIWGPSCIASAEVAAFELNRRDGVAGRNVRLILIDSAVEAPMPVEGIVDTLIESRSIDAIVGMHISAVRQSLTKVVRGRVPYVYTPMYEGGENGEGVFAIGDTPSHQLVPAIRWLHSRYRLRKWALIGNDYVWPRESHRYAKSTLAAMHAALVYERYLPFAAPNLVAEVESLAKSGADAVLISLIGQDAVDFNRIFGDQGLDRRIVRLTCVIEENGLLASGAENLRRLFCSSSFFGALATESNACFREVYHSFHGHRAPVLGALGQSTYEGMHFLASLMGDGSESWPKLCELRTGPITYRSARQAAYHSNSNNRLSTFIARADGVTYQVIEKIFQSQTIEDLLDADSKIT
ncbi:MAG: substrate-binding domain-containing protein [Paracoccaceae bacterium]|nr:substrate-binding domain-containing protein [Paracoccaceae bacterium]